MIFARGSTCCGFTTERSHQPLSLVAQEVEIAIEFGYCLACWIVPKMDFPILILSRGRTCGIKFDTM